MNMRLWFRSAMLVLGVVFVFSGAAYAQSQSQLKQDLEINVYGAGVFYATKSFEVGFPQSTVPMSGEFKLDNAIRGGVRVNVYTRGHWGQEFFYSYEPNTAHFIRQNPAGSLDLDLNVSNVGINAVYYLNDDESQRMRPFLGIGIGAAVYSPTGGAKAIARDPLQGNVPDLDTANELTMNYGGGVKFRLNDWAGVRIDLRGFLGRNPSFGLPRSSPDPNATVFPAGGAMNSGEASIGFVFYFGKP